MRLRQVWKNERSSESCHMAGRSIEIQHYGTIENSYRTSQVGVLYTIYVLQVALASWLLTVHTIIHNVNSSSVLLVLLLLTVLSTQRHYVMTVNGCVVVVWLLWLFLPTLWIYSSCCWVHTGLVLFSVVSRAR